ncbi:DUF1661 domain-containing protein [Porphyromonas gingivalis]|uniref:DUF1661 domain-containing protein n=1 Tax=Porphyromonas gingivalis TaxID=837 RepID=UPI00117D0D78|nr:DUF1661 domain-containing protein [Porphyromonas gingivalis]
MKPWSFDVDPSNQYPRSCCFCSYEPKTLRLWCLNPEKTAREFFASRTKSKKIPRHVFRSNKCKNFGT